MLLLEIENVEKLHQIGIGSVGFPDAGSSQRKMGKWRRKYGGVEKLVRPRQPRDAREIQRLSAPRLLQAKIRNIIGRGAGARFSATPDGLRR